MSGVNDVTGKAVKDFLAEAEEILDQLCADLADMSDGTDSGECNPDTLNSVFRGAHSLKGLAGMFGFAAIQDLSHNMENLLAAMIADTAPADLRGTAYGVFNLGSGVALLLASALAGLLWDQCGPPATFVAGAVLATTALGLLLMQRPA